jgi:hypothetical protein
MGCPVGSGWSEVDVTGAAATIWAELVDQSPWTDEDDFRESAIAPYDRNADGLICLKTMWGELNPESHWFGVTQFLVRDNTANATNS